ncbi:MAG: hypothetical protein GY799_26905 [Desulfobulbaceae bacterium]|nr:hypothetical protein [Desulfobulbaceae bacterium]
MYKKTGVQKWNEGGIFAGCEQKPFAKTIQLIDVGWGGFVILRYLWQRRHRNSRISVTQRTPTQAEFYWTSLDLAILREQVGPNEDQNRKVLEGRHVYSQDT